MVGHSSGSGDSKGAHGLETQCRQNALEDVRNVLWVWRIHHGTFLRLGVVRTRRVVVISWVCWCKSDRVTSLWLVV